MEKITKEIKPNVSNFQKYVDMWRLLGSKPRDIEPVGPGEESVWDYPRPPAIQLVETDVLVKLGPHEILKTKEAVRVCETASAPTYYFKKEDFLFPFENSPIQTSCEWKGEANYYHMSVEGELLKNAFWSYPNPTHEYSILKDMIGFYPGAFETYLFGEQVQPQPGGFYAGWVTKNIKGPIKGASGSRNW